MQEKGGEKELNVMWLKSIILKRATEIQSIDTFKVIRKNPNLSKFLNLQKYLKNAYSKTYEANRTWFKDRQNILLCYPQTVLVFIILNIFNLSKIFLK